MVSINFSFSGQYIEDIEYIYSVLKVENRIRFLVNAYKDAGWKPIGGFEEDGSRQEIMQIL